MEPEMQGFGHWYDTTSWSSGTQQAIGTALQTAGMIGLMALGGPEAEAVMGAEEGPGAESMGFDPWVFKSNELSRKRSPRGKTWSDHGHTTRGLSLRLIG